jgi:ribulose-phosphate 3-epimerase
MCARLERLADEIGRLEEAGVDGLHLDVMDGHFVPNLALSPTVIAAIRPLTRLPFDVHLMVQEPGRYVPALRDAGADVVVFHAEAAPYPLRLCDEIEAAGMRAGVAFSVGTPLPELPELYEVDTLLVMAVEPGFAGQRWMPSTLSRVERVRERAAPATAITVDGGVGPDTIGDLLRAGADSFVCGSTGLFRRDGTEYATAVSDLRARLAEAARPVAQEVLGTPG